MKSSPDPSKGEEGKNHATKGGRGLKRQLVKFELAFYFCGMTQRDRLSKRNKAVRATFDALQRRHPQWRLDAIIDKLSERYFVAPRQ